MRWLAFPLIIVTAAAVAADKVYKIVHPDGSVEYSSEPAPGSEEIQLPALPTYEPRRSAPPTATASQAPLTVEAPVADETPEAVTDYRVTITRPSPDETLFFDGAGASVSASLDPPLNSAQGHVLVFLLDGIAMARVSGTSTTLHIERGSHTLSARVETREGEVLASSEPVPFHMRQPSILRPLPPSRPGGAPSITGGAPSIPGGAPSIPANPSLP